MISYHFRFLAVCVSLLPLACDSPEPPLVRITARDFIYDAPDTIPAGLLHFRRVNQGADIHEAMFVRLTSSAGSASAYADSARADVDFPAFALDMGGPGLTNSRDSNDVWIELEPGRYAMVCWKGDHLDRGMARDFVVVPGGAKTTRVAEDLSIITTEYGYRLSGPVAPGHRIIKVENQ
jgi:hypothetical protein